MSTLKLNSIVERITILRKDPQTGKMYVADAMRNASKKSGSKMLRPVEKLVRRLGRAEARSAAIYSERHENSSRKKKNGWLYEMISNMRKAQKQGWKSSKKSSK